MSIPKNILLTRNDGIGDMVLMFPMCGLLKRQFPQTRIAVLGKPYTEALVKACSYVDEFITESEFMEGEALIAGEKIQVIIHVRTDKQVALRAKELRIPIRVGTASRMYHWTTCNKLVWLRRKSSRLHEAQLNVKLLRPLGIKEIPTRKELGILYGLNNLSELRPSDSAMIDAARYNLIVHPKSQGSSREWPISHFISLINLLPEERFNIFLSGVEKERSFIDEIVKGVRRPVISLVGQMPLADFLPFIKACDGLLANATGPLHLAAALAVDAFGLYPPIRPIDPGRWEPLGPKPHVFVLNKDCNKCAGRKHDCSCMQQLEPAIVAAGIIEAGQKTNRA